MNGTHLRLVFLAAWLAVGSGSPGQETSAPPTAASGVSEAAGDQTAIETQIGGVGGVYFLADPGDLIVDVEKCDRNRRAAPTQLRAILVGPDRRVCQEAIIPDDAAPLGKLGPPQRARLSTRVDRKGVYALNVTVSQDRYGDAMVWGFRTNCPHYLIETSRGHRDAPHEEPLVLFLPERPGNVCFLPRRGTFDMEITGLPRSTGTVSVYDGNNSLVQTLQVGPDGRALRAFAAAEHRDAVPWRLSLPSQQATVHIDGVTRWDRRDIYQDLPCWTPDPKSFFPLLQYRWLLTPYSRTVYGRAGETGEIAFRVHNNSDRRKTVRLSLEFPSEPWLARLSAQQVVLGPKGGCSVMIGYTVPPDGQARTVHLRATPAENPDFTTYSTLLVKAGVAPAAAPLDLPLVLKPYRHENEQLGYLPDYPTENQVYFDLRNRPCVRTSAGVAIWCDGRWTTSDLRTSVKWRDAAFDGQTLAVASSKIAFDRDGDMYLLATAGRRGALVHSADGGRTFSAYLIPGREDRPASLDIEQFSGHNVPEGPPPILRYTQTDKDPRLTWREINDLELLLPKKTGGRISFGKPLVVSRHCIGLAAHSGIPSSVVSRAGRVHVVWGEATDPAAKSPGTPAFVRSYDRDTGALGEPVLVGHGAPANDVHNSPSITIDGKGYLHVLAGTHGRPFPYACSREPNTAHAGWTTPMPTGEKLEQTYIGLVCGPDDTLHLVFRLWRHGEKPFPASHYAALAYQRKQRGKSWEPPRILVVPPFSEYSVYYHRITIDRSGGLFLSYDAWSTYWFYRTDHPGSRRALLTSADGGQTWGFAKPWGSASRLLGDSRGR